MDIKYTVEFNGPEIHALLECLATLRTTFAESSGNPSDHPVFVAASELQYKIAHIINPDTGVSIEEYLNFGKKL